MKTYFAGILLARPVWDMLSDELWHLLRHFSGLASLQQGMASFQAAVNDSAGVTHTRLLLTAQKKQTAQNSLFNNRENVNLTGFRSGLNTARRWQLQEA